MRRPPGRRKLAWIAVCILPFGGPANAAPDEGAALRDSPPLDLTGYRLTFDETFRRLDVSGRPGSGARWYSHTPWAGDFGEAPFMDPSPEGPFIKTARGLDIVAREETEGHWTSGLISSRDRDGPEGKGFAQAYGYFEIKAKLPQGMGLWPAFWLIGVDKSNSAAEIDVMEDYGGFPDTYHCTVHIWRGNSQDWGSDFLIHVRKNILSSRYNLFGVLITRETTRFYFNRKAVAEIETPPEYRQPFYVLADLALGGGWPTGALRSPQTMSIAYIRAYAPAEAPP